MVKAVKNLSLDLKIEQDAKSQKTARIDELLQQMEDLKVSQKIQVEEVQTLLEDERARHSNDLAQAASESKDKLENMETVLRQQTEEIQVIEGEKQKLKIKLRNMETNYESNKRLLIVAEKDRMKFKEKCQILDDCLEVIEMKLRDKEHK